MSALSSFLKTYRCDKSQTPTHTRIGNIELGIFGGSYSIPNNEMDRFYELYYDAVFVNGNKEYLTEKQNQDSGMMYVDLDFNYSSLERHHSVDTKKDIMFAYLTSIKKYIQLYNEEFPIYIMEREQPYFNGSKYKDGLHIIFGLDINRSVQKLIRKDVMTNIDLQLPLINDIDDVYDEGLTTGKTNIQILGSIKPNCEPYKITHHFNVKVDESDGEFIIDEVPVEMSLEIFKSCQVHYERPFVFASNKALQEIADFEKESKSKSPRTVVSHPDSSFENDISILQKLGQCWSAERINKTDSWFKLGWGIANVFGKSPEVVSLFIDLNDKVKKRSNEKMKAKEWFIEKCEIRTDKDAIGIGSLHKWAKDDNKELYDKLFKKPTSKCSNHLKELFDDDFSSGRFAQYFAKEYNEQFICVKTNIYHFNGVYWKKDFKNLILHKFIDEVVYSTIMKVILDNLFKIVEQIREKQSEMDGYNDKDPARYAIKSEISELERKKSNIEFTKKTYNKIREHACRKQLIEDIIIHLNCDIELDTNPYLFAFENKVFDLKLGNFTKPNPKDYLTLSCGWYYNESYDLKTRKSELMKIIDTIFPEIAVRDFYLEAASTGLFGQQTEYLFIATGSGGNGKSLLNTLIMSSIGNYAYNIPSSTLLKEIKEGANPQMALLDKKRFVLTAEPDAKRRIHSSTMKEITGNKTLNVRDNYSSVCDTTLHNSTFMEANELPLLTEVNDAIIRRIKTIPFISSFVDQNTYDSLEDKTNIFVGNTFYKSDEFLSQNKQALFHILVEYFKIFMKNNNKISAMPQSCYEVGRKYFMMSDGFYAWFSDNYKKDETGMEYVSDIFEKYKYSSAFELLSKEDKRKHTKSRFNEDIQKHMFLKKQYIPRHTTFNRIKIDKPAIVGYKYIVDEEKPIDKNE